jgi:hypothetical protein
MRVSAAIASVMVALQAHLVLALPFLTLALRASALLALALPYQTLIFLASALLVQVPLALGFLILLLPVASVLRNHSFLRGEVWTGKIYMSFVFENIEGLRTQILRKQDTE